MDLEELDLATFDKAPPAGGFTDAELVAVPSPVEAQTATVPPSPSSAPNDATAHAAISSAKIMHDESDKSAGAKTNEVVHEVSGKFEAASDAHVAAAAILEDAATLIRDAAGVSAGVEAGAGHDDVAEEGSKSDDASEASSSDKEDSEPKKKAVKKASSKKFPAASKAKGRALPVLAPPSTRGKRLERAASSTTGKALPPKSKPPPKSAVKATQKKK